MHAACIPIGRMYTLGFKWTPWATSGLRHVAIQSAKQLIIKNISLILKKRHPAIVRFFLGHFNLALNSKVNEWIGVKCPGNPKLILDGRASAGSMMGVFSNNSFITFMNSSFIILCQIRKFLFTLCAVAFDKKKYQLKSRGRGASTLPSCTFCK